MATPRRLWLRDRSRSRLKEGAREMANRLNQLNLANELETVERQLLQSERGITCQQRGGRVVS
jgi:hypothetical protein